MNIGSINGHGGQSNLPAYACTKGALMTMTKHSAWALRRDHIRVNYIAVGWMYTPAEDQIMQSEGASPDWIQEADKNHPYVRSLWPHTRMHAHTLSHTHARVRTRTQSHTQTHTRTHARARTHTHWFWPCGPVATLLL